jgi:hypothetical protein
VPDSSSFSSARGAPGEGWDNPGQHDDDGKPTAEDDRFAAAVGRSNAPMPFSITAAIAAASHARFGSATERIVGERCISTPLLSPCSADLRRVPAGSRLANHALPITASKRAT